MIQFLASIFIKNRQDYSSPAVRQAYGTLCGAVGIGLNILLFLGKWMAGFLSGSIAITADAFNNLSDNPDRFPDLRTETRSGTSFRTRKNGVYFRTSGISCHTCYGI